MREAPSEDNNDLIGAHQVGRIHHLRALETYLFGYFSQASLP